jgi:hypothetical protein
VVPRSASRLWSLDGRLHIPATRKELSIDLCGQFIRSSFISRIKCDSDYSRWRNLPESSYISWHSAFWNPALHYPARLWVQSPFIDSQRYRLWHARIFSCCILLPHSNWLFVILLVCLLCRWVSLVARVLVHLQISMNIFVSGILQFRFCPFSTWDSRSIRFLRWMMFCREDKAFVLGLLLVWAP